MDFESLEKQMKILTDKVNLLENKVRRLDESYKNRGKELNELRKKLKEMEITKVSEVRTGFVPTFMKGM